MSPADRPVNDAGFGPVSGPIVGPIEGPVEESVETVVDDSGRRRRQMKHFAGLTTARGAASAISGIWIIVAARRLTITQFGDLSILLALGSIFINISDVGLQVVIGDHVARAGSMSRRVVLEGVRRRLVYAAGCAVCVVVLYLVAASDKNVVVPLVFAGSVLGTAVYQIVLAAYRAQGRVTADAVNEVASRSGLLICGFAVLVFGWGLVGASAVYGAADLVSAVAVTAFVARRYFVRDDAAAPPDLRLRATAPLAVAITIWLVYLRIDGYLVGLLSGPSEAGLYGAAYRFLDVAMLPALVLSHTVLAHVSPLNGRERLAEIHRFLRLSVGVAIPIAIGGSLLVGPVLVWLFPPAFASAQAVAVLLLISSVPGAVVATLAPLAGVSDRRQFAYTAAAALGFNVALNLVLIPRYGAAGAAWATVISQVFLGAALYPVVRRGCTRREPSAVVSSTPEDPPC